MTRNMEKRVEIAWPIQDEALKAQINDYLDISLSDTAKLRMLKNDLNFTPLGYFAARNEEGAPEEFNSQDYLIKKAHADYELSVAQREEQAAQRSATARAQRVRDREILAAQAREAEQEQENAYLPTEPGPQTSADEPEVEAASEENAAPVADVSTEPEALHGDEAEAEPETPVSISTDDKRTEAVEHPFIGIEEIEPGVAGPIAADKPAAAAPEMEPIVAPAEVLPVSEATSSSSDAIQLVPKKPSFWQRLKFLFTGKL